MILLRPDNLGTDLWSLLSDNVDSIPKLDAIVLQWTNRSGTEIVTSSPHGSDRPCKQLRHYLSAVMMKLR